LVVLLLLLLLLLPLLSTGHQTSQKAGRVCYGVLSTAAAAVAQANTAAED
jgi:hypothetical protein